VRISYALMWRSAFRSTFGRRSRALARRLNARARRRTAAGPAFWKKVRRTCDLTAKEAA